MLESSGDGDGIEVVGKHGVAAATVAREHVPGSRSAEQVYRLIKLLTARGGFFASFFCRETLVEVCQHLEYRKVPPGTSLLKEGDIYIVAVGRLRIACDGRSAGQEGSHCEQADKDDSMESSVPLMRCSQLASGISLSKSQMIRRHLSEPARTPQSTSASKRERAGLRLVAAAASTSKLHDLTAKARESEHMRLKPCRSSPAFTAFTAHAPQKKPPASSEAAAAPAAIKSPSGTARKHDPLEGRLHLPLLDVMKSLADGVERDHRTEQPGHFGGVFDRFTARIQGALGVHGLGDYPGASSSHQEDDCAVASSHSRRAGTAIVHSSSEVNVLGKESHSEAADTARLSSGSSDLSRSDTVQAIEASARRMSQTNLDFSAAALASAHSYTKASEATAGQVVGVRASFHAEPHDWTATALDECELLALKASTLRDFVELERQKRRAVRENALIKSAGSLRTADRDKLDRLIECFRSSSHRRGAVLCWEGEARTAQPETDKLQIIVEGRVRAVKAWKRAETGSEGSRPSTAREGALRRGANIPSGQDVGTLLPGHIINGASQLLGASEPFTVVVDSAELTIISAARSELSRLAGTGVYESLRTAAEEFARWHEQRVPALSKRQRFAGGLQSSAPRRESGLGGSAVKALPTSILHGYRETRSKLVPIPPKMSKPLEDSAVSELLQGRKGHARAARGGIGHLRQRRYVVNPKEQLECQDSNDRHEGDMVPAECESRRASSSRADVASVQDSGGDECSPNQCVTTAQSPRGLEAASPCFSQCNSLFMGSLLLDSTLAPEDSASLPSNTIEARRISHTTPSHSRQIEKEAAGQLLKRQHMNMSLLPSSLEHLVVRGDKAEMVRVGPISPLHISTMGRPPSSASTSRQLLGSAKIFTMEAEEAQNDVDVEDSRFSSKQSTEQSEIDDSFWISGGQPPCGRLPAHNVSVASAASAAPANLSDRSLPATVRVDQRRPQSDPLSGLVPLMQSQLNHLDEAFQLLRTIGGRELLERESMHALEESQVSTMAADDLGHASMSVDDVWQQMFSVMSSVDSTQSRRVAASRIINGDDAPAPKPLSAPGAIRQTLPPSPGAPRQSGALQQAPVIKPCRGGSSRDRRLQQKSAWKRLNPVAGWSGGRPLSEAAPLSVHSIEHFLEASHRRTPA